MPSLDWIGKHAVRNHHQEVPYHLLKCDRESSVGDPGSGSLLVQGDNLLALKAMLPYYAGKVKCIYIDPPYNTGNEGWVYNDAVNSAEMRAWLGKVVGKEVEDLSRHDKWLCMMYPRLSLLKRFMRQDGAIFVSIADHEVHHLRLLMDEIFGAANFVATIIWQKVYSPKNSAKHFSEDHDYIVVYARKAELWRPKLIARSAEQDKAYKNPDNDPRGPWKPSDLSARNFYSEGTYSVTCPSGRVIERPPTGRYYSVSPESFAKLDDDKRIWWGKAGNSKPQVKRFLSDVMQGRVPQTLWSYAEVGHTQEGKKELVAICDFEDSDSVFITPKPVRLIKRILEIASDKDSIILDSFAGSGTTGHAVLSLNKEDGGDRRFLLIEMEESICRSVTKQRLQRVIQGHNDTPATGGGFRYCSLGSPLFDEHGSIRDQVSFADLAAHVYFSETGEPIPKRAGKSPLLGVHQGRAIYLLFNGVLGDKRPAGGNVLTHAIAQSLPAHPEGKGDRVVFGEACRLSPASLKQYGITFRQVPFELKVD
jgi:site-specific DNA-methyltransferase (adenine-specific)/adenine-specific DNA-methyltransferase